MNLVPNTIRRKASVANVKMKQNSPHFMFGGGLVGVVLGTVLACRATLKLEKELDAFREELESVDVNDGRSTSRIYAKHSLILLKMYAPALIAGGIGVGLLTKSHMELNRRNKALTAAYAALTQAFNEYRQRVRNVVGEEEELKLYLGADVEKIKVDGVQVESVTLDPNNYSIHARIFDESNEHYKKDAEWNMVFLRHQQNWFNHLLQKRRHVFLNEVYEALGFEHTQQGGILGWVIDTQTPNYIDFGFFTGNANRFVNGDERAVILDFNINGVIIDKIG